MDTEKHTAKKTTVKRQKDLGDAQDTFVPPAGDPLMLMDIYHRLYAAFGPQNWWPAETAVEMIVGAVLTQNTAWTQVEKAIARLKHEGVLTLEGLGRLLEQDLARLIRPSGYFNVKARRLKAVVDFIFQDYGGDLERMFSVNTPDLRKALLSVKGLGPETVDSILLYAGGHPSFVVDAYTRRILSRHELISEKAQYHVVQDFFMSQLPQKTQLFNEYHALIVRTAKDFCKKTPNCSRCPLNTLPGFQIDRPPGRVSNP